jgi:hypothetical protein
MADHVLKAPIEFIAGKLAAMGTESGYRRDYRGLRRWSYALPLEDDQAIPWVQLDLGDNEEGKPESNTRHFPDQDLVIQVHVMADRLDNGELDVIAPTLEVMADIHQAAYADRNLGVQYCWIERKRREIREFGVGVEPIGSTVRAVYTIHYWHAAADEGVPE